MNEEEKKIVKGCKERDERAFELLYKKYYRMLLGIAMRYSKDKMEAEDVLQDAFIRVFNSIDAFSEKGSFEGWLKRIVQNTAINNYRKNLKHNLYVDLADKENELMEDSFPELLGGFEVKDIVVMLNAMPDGYRVVMNLYYIDGYSHREISAMLGITEGTSKSQLFKARAFMKDLIENNLNRSA